MQDLWEVANLGFVVDFDSKWKLDEESNQATLSALSGLDNRCAVISGKQRGRLILVYKKLFAVAVGEEDGKMQSNWPYAIAMLGQLAKQEGVEVTKEVVDAIEDKN
jgi:hypothetical protein